ncbi:MAG TPA: hypothetical protein VML96_02480 [Egibacteraceae bacterium]|nr:hypothetical protein [Egibacteraceae bacterium]
MSASADLIRSAERAILAEIAYRRPDASVGICALVPLVHDEEVVFALTYAARPLAEALIASSSAAIVLSEPRLAFPGWAPATAAVRLRVEADRDGAMFTAELLEQELRKHPPSRKYTDSLVARREHWWYLPRLLVRVSAIDVGAIPARTLPTDGVVAWDDGGAIRATVAGVEDWEAGQVRLSWPVEASPPEQRRVATLYRHDFAVPDLEPRCEQTLEGELRGSQLTVQRRRGRAGPPERSRLRERVLETWSLSRACRRELALARHGRTAIG